MPCTPWQRRAGSTHPGAHGLVANCGDVPPRAESATFPHDCHMAAWSTSAPAVCCCPVTGPCWADGGASAPSPSAGTTVLSGACHLVRPSHEVHGCMFTSFSLISDESRDSGDPVSTAQGFPSGSCRPWGQRGHPGWAQGRLDQAPSPECTAQRFGQYPLPTLEPGVAVLQDTLLCWVDHGGAEGTGLCTASRGCRNTSSQTWG